MAENPLIQKDEIVAALRDLKIILDALPENLVLSERANLTQKLEQALVPFTPPAVAATGEAHGQHDFAAADAAVQDIANALLKELKGFLPAAS